MTPLRILIVDDSLVMRMMASQLVTSLGHEVVAEAVDGKDGVKKFLKHKPDVVLLDLVMPILDGKKTLKKIRTELDTDANVIICSSLGSLDDRQFCMDLGAKAYIQKPYEASVLQRELDIVSQSLTAQTV